MTPTTDPDVIAVIVRTVMSRPDGALLSELADALAGIASHRKTQQWTLELAANGILFIDKRQNPNRYYATEAARLYLVTDPDAVVALAARVDARKRTSGSGDPRAPEPPADAGNSRANPDRAQREPIGLANADDLPGSAADRAAHDTPESVGHAPEMTPPIGDRSAPISPVCQQVENTDVPIHQALPKLDAKSIPGPDHKSIAGADPRSIRRDDAQSGRLPFGAVSKQRADGDTGRVSNAEAGSADTISDAKSEGLPEGNRPNQARAVPQTIAPVPTESTASVDPQRADRVATPDTKALVESNPPHSPRAVPRSMPGRDVQSLSRVEPEGPQDTDSGHAASEQRTLLRPESGPAVQENSMAEGFAKLHRISVVGGAVAVLIVVAVIVWPTREAQRPSPATVAPAPKASGRLTWPAATADTAAQPGTTRLPAVGLAESKSVSPGAPAPDVAITFHPPTQPRTDAGVARRGDLDSAPSSETTPGIAQAKSNYPAPVPNLTPVTQPDPSEPSAATPARAVPPVASATAPTEPSPPPLPAWPTTAGAYVLVGHRWQSLPHNHGHVVQTNGDALTAKLMDEQLEADPAAAATPLGQVDLGRLVFDGTDAVPGAASTDFLAAYVGPLASSPELERSAPPMELGTLGGTVGQRQATLHPVAPHRPGFGPNRITATLEHPRAGVTLLRTTAPLRPGTYALLCGTEAYELQVR